MICGKVKSYKVTYIQFDLRIQLLQYSNVCALSANTKDHDSNGSKLNNVLLSLLYTLELKLLFVTAFAALMAVAPSGGISLNMKAMHWPSSISN